MQKLVIDQNYKGLHRFREGYLYLEDQIVAPGDVVIDVREPLSFCGSIECGGNLTINNPIKLKTPVEKMIKVGGDIICDHVMATDGVCFISAKDIKAQEMIYNGTLMCEKLVVQKGFNLDPADPYSKVSKLFHDIRLNIWAFDTRIKADSIQVDGNMFCSQIEAKNHVFVRNLMVDKMTVGGCVTGSVIAVSQGTIYRNTVCCDLTAGRLDCYGNMLSDKVKAHVLHVGGSVFTPDLTVGQELFVGNKMRVKRIQGEPVENFAEGQVYVEEHNGIRCNFVKLCNGWYRKPVMHNDKFKMNGSAKNNMREHC